MSASLYCDFYGTRAHAPSELVTEELARGTLKLVQNRVERFTKEAGPNSSTRSKLIQPKSDATRIGSFARSGLRRNNKAILMVDALEMDSRCEQRMVGASDEPRPRQLEPKEKGERPSRSTPFRRVRSLHLVIRLVTIGRQTCRHLRNVIPRHRADTLNHAQNSLLIGSFGCSAA